VFDLISGVPLHPLLVHASVVLLPLMAVVTPLVVARPTWRPALRWVVIADFLVLVAVFATVQAGEALQSRLSQKEGRPVAEDHGELGDLLTPVALLLFLVALAAVYAIRKGGILIPAAVVVVSLVGLTAIGMTVVVGHSGATAVWKDEVAGTPAPQGD
jgi:uncharacterized membrane protein